MRPRFLADADFNHKIVVGLRRREPSVDFLSAYEGGVVGLPDAEVIITAAESGRILVSHDRRTMPAHFARFRETRSSPGIVIVSQGLEIISTGSSIASYVTVREPSIWHSMPIRTAAAGRRRSRLPAGSESKA